MGYTKRQFVNAAFDEIGFASYEFDLSPERQQAALRRLDAMMAEWNGKGIRLGYPIPTSPTSSDLDEQTSVPDWSNEAIILNLAVRIAPSVGKVVSPDTKIAAKMAYNTLLTRSAAPTEMQFPDTLPLGAGHKAPTADTVFFPAPTDPLLAGSDSEIALD